MAEINANWLAEAVEHSEEYKRLEAENAELRANQEAYRLKALSLLRDILALCEYPDITLDMVGVVIAQGIHAAEEANALA